MTRKPRKPARSADPVAELRKNCLALPEAHEVEAWGEPTFRVKNKIFAMFASENTHHGGGRPGVWIKSNFTVQEIVLRSDPDMYFKPPYVGPSGWIGAFLDGKPDWNTIRELLLDAYGVTAPKKLLAKLEHSSGEPTPRKRGAEAKKKPAKR